jgi:hypothetical protein
MPHDPQHLHAEHANQTLFEALGKVALQRLGMGFSQDSHCATDRGLDGPEQVLSFHRWVRPLIATASSSA